MQVQLLQKLPKMFLIFYQNLIKVCFLRPNRHFLLHLFDLGPVSGHHRLEEGHQVGGTFVRRGHMALHRPDGRATEQADKGIDWHKRASPAIEKGASIKLVPRPRQQAVT